MRAKTYDLSLAFLRIGRRAAAFNHQRRTLRRAGGHGY